MDGDDGEDLIGDATSVELEAGMYGLQVRFIFD